MSAKNLSCDTHPCITIIDAGSTGSRVHIYSYDIDETKTPTHITEVWSKKTKPGFSTIELTHNTIDTYLTRLLSDAPSYKGPVYFYATAGMRLLPSWKQKLYYEELESWFKQHNQWHLMEAKTITGNEEAIYGWLSVNYHLNTLKTSQGHSIGVMDMGGASVQVVLPIQKNDAIDEHSQINLNIYGRNIRLFIHSFLGLGQTEITHQFLNSAMCFPNEYPLPDGDSGQGNATGCAQEVSNLMNSVHNVNKIIQPVLSTNPVNSWYTMGGLANLADNKIFNFTNQQFTNESLLEQADSRVCHQSWEQLDSQYPQDDYMYGYCLFSAYFYALMVEGYGLAPKQPVHYIAPETNLDWTQGALLIVGSEPYQTPIA